MFSQNLTVIDFFGQVLSGVLPGSLTELNIYNSLQKPLVPGILPRSLIRLRSYGSYTHPFTPGIFPDSLTHLVLQNYHHCLIRGSLPDSLMSLEYGDSSYHCHEITLLDHRMEYLPDKLKVLRLGNEYNQPIDDGILPVSLEELSFGCCFNQPLDHLSSLTRCVSLKFGELFAQPMNRFSLPPTLTDLTFDVNYNPREQSVVKLFPTSLTQIKLKTISWKWAENAVNHPFINILNNTSHLHNITNVLFVSE